MYYRESSLFQNGVLPGYWLSLTHLVKFTVVPCAEKQGVPAVLGLGTATNQPKKQVRWQINELTIGIGSLLDQRTNQRNRFVGRSTSNLSNRFIRRSTNQPKIIGSLVDQRTTIGIGSLVDQRTNQRNMFAGRSTSNLSNRFVRRSTKQLKIIGSLVDQRTNHRNRFVSRSTNQSKEQVPWKINNQPNEQVRWKINEPT